MPAELHLRQPRRTAIAGCITSRCAALQLLHLLLSSVICSNLSWHLAGGSTKPQSPGQHAQPPPPPVVRITRYSRGHFVLAMIMKQFVLAKPQLCHSDV